MDVEGRDKAAIEPFKTWYGQTNRPFPNFLFFSHSPSSDRSATLARDLKKEQSMLERAAGEGRTEVPTLE